MTDTDQCVAVVTGGARGIGAAITTTLARAGYKVAAEYSANQASAEEFAAKLIADGLSVSVHKGNVGVPADCGRVIEEVLTLHGRVDVLVNNAGITVDKTVRRMTIDNWHAVLRVNLFGAFYMVQAVLEHRLERGFGRIINISSVVAETGAFGQANYMRRARDHRRANRRNPRLQIIGGGGHGHRVPCERHRDRGAQPQPLGIGRRQAAATGTGRG